MKKYDYEKEVGKAIRKYMKRRVKGPVEDGRVVRFLTIDLTCDADVSGPGRTGAAEQASRAESCLAFNYPLIEKIFGKTGWVTNLTMNGSVVCDHLIRRYMIERLLPGIVEEWNRKEKEKAGKKKKRTA